MAPPSRSGLVAVAGLTGMMALAALAALAGWRLPLVQQEETPIARSVVALELSTTYTMIDDGRPAEAGGVVFDVMSGEHFDETKVPRHRNVSTTFPDSMLVDPKEESGEASDVGYAYPPGTDNWGLRKIDAIGRLLTGKGVHIYVLDTGVRATHIEFGGRCVPTWDGRLGRACGRGEKNCARDMNGHGTHVAAIAGGAHFGVAPQAVIHAVAALIHTAEKIIFLAAIQWVTQNKVPPAVMTISSNMPGGVDLQLEDAVTRAVSAGIVVTVSAGNGDENACLFTWAHMAPTSLGVIAVANSDQNDRRATDSNWGSCVTIFAPGVGIFSADSSRDDAATQSSGTSMSTPFVAGAIALSLQNKVRAPAEVEQFLFTRDRFFVEENVIMDPKGSPNARLSLEALR